MTDSRNQTVAQLLVAARAGDETASARVDEVVYDELRSLASRLLRNERDGQTLRTTALVNEAYVRLAGQDDKSWEDRLHFLNVAARAMRSILVDYARHRSAQKRGGDWSRVPLDAVFDGLQTDQVDLIALDEALKRLESIAPRKSRVVELRFFGGLSRLPRRRSCSAFRTAQLKTTGHSRARGCIVSCRRRIGE